MDLKNLKGSAALPSSDIEQKTLSSSGKEVKERCCAVLVGKLVGLMVKERFLLPCR